MKENRLKRSIPEQQGVSSEAVLKFIEEVEKVRTQDMAQDFHSFMLLRHGFVIAEGWWEPYDKDFPHMLFSLSKSFTSTAIGFAVAEKLLTVEDKVVSYFKEECPNPDGNLAKMRIKDLLSMATGHVEDTMEYLMSAEDKNWVKAFFQVPVKKEPGTHFLYNTGATYMLSVLIQKVSKVKLVEYLRPRLFEPLGIEVPVWEECPNGYNTGGFGLNIKTEDIAKFGQLYLNQGVWENRQIIPKEWIEEATSYKISNGDNEDSDWSQGYCYQFWRCRHNAYRGDGAFGQYCVVVPDLDAVIAITGGMKDLQLPLNLIWEHLLPGFQDGVLTETINSKKLEQKLSTLKLLLPDGVEMPQCADTMIGKEYILEENDLGFERIRFHLKNKSLTITIHIGKQKKELTVGFGKWEEGYLPIDGPFRHVMLTGAWQEDGSFFLWYRSVETPFGITLFFSIKDSKLMMKGKANVGFDKQEWFLIKGEPVQENC